MIDCDPSARTLRAIVAGAQNPGALIQIRAKFRPGPCVVSQSDDISTGTENKIGLLRGDPDNVGVLSVDNGKRDVTISDELFQAVGEKTHPRLAADVTHSQYFNFHYDFLCVSE